MAREPDSLKVRRAAEKGEAPPVWLWAGPEEYLKDELFALVARTVAGEAMGALNVSRFRAGDDALETVLSTCNTLPMLGDRRVVLLREVEALAKADRERLVAYAAAPCPETALVLTGERGTADSFHRALIEAGAVPAMFWIPFEADTRRWIQIKFREQGKQCSPETAQDLLELCGGGHGRQVPLREVAPEIEKVVLAVGDREAVAEQDLAVIGRRADEKLLYAITERTLAGDLPGALRALDGALLFKDNSEVRIVANLMYTLINVATAQDLLEAGLSGPEARKAMGAWPKAWPDLERAARRRPRSALTRGLDALAQADRTLKSSSRNPRLVLEETIITICSTKN